MASSTGDRSEFFPAIEKKHGGPIAVWIERLRDLGDAKYPEQISYLRENHGFSQTHANALVMYVRGSATSRRFETPTDYWRSVSPAGAKTGRAIMATIRKAHPDLELVVAWNHPVLRNDVGYVFGLSVATAHVNINPFSSTAVEQLSDRLRGYEVNKKTFKVPFGWKIDADLLNEIIELRLAELGDHRAI